MFPLNEASSLTCHNCRQLKASSALILPMNSSSIDLRDFQGTCLSDPELCVDGMTFEIWVWFAEYGSSRYWPNGDILKAGGRFHLSIASNNISFIVLYGDHFQKCEVRITGDNQWLHVVGRWVKDSNSPSLYVNNQTCAHPSKSYVTVGNDTKLSLGPVSKVREGYVVAKNLSIWMRALNESELENLMRSSMYLYIYNLCILSVLRRASHCISRLYFITVEQNIVISCGKYQPNMNTFCT